MHPLTRISCATLTSALAIGLIVSACSSDKSGTRDGGGATAGSSNSGGGHGGSSAASGGSSVQPGAGSSNGGASSVGTGGSSVVGSGGSSGVIPTAACPGLPFDGSAAGEGGASDAACTGVSVEAESVPVDMFIMMDRSQSMGFTLPNSTMTRWDALKAAVQSFVSAPSAGAIGAGIGFFSLSGAQADDALDCSAAEYAKPAVA